MISPRLRAVRLACVLFCLAVLFPAPALSTDVAPGFDLSQTTPDPTATYWDFTFWPIPADFFGPGSDPFDGTVFLRGFPLGTSPFCPADDLSNVDTIIERQATATLPGAPSEDIVPIELVELSLISVEPITVTYNGGQDPELWDVAMTISPALPSTGEMLIRQESELGGTFDAYLDVSPRFTFTRVDDGAEMPLDLGEMALAQHYNTFGVPWEYWDTPPELCGTDICINLGDLSVWQAAYGMQTVESRCPPPAGADVVDRGHDLYETDPQSTYHDFSGTPIPADFFGPGSDPFVDIVPLAGVPLGTSQVCPDDDLSQVDTIVERLQDAVFPEIPSQQTIDIELVELSLRSMEPIRVTYNGGQDPELWDVDVGVSPTVPSIGQMTLRKEHENGGFFNSFLPVYPLFTFTRIDDGTELQWDLGQEGISTDYHTFDVPWEHTVPPAGSCTSNFCANPDNLTLWQAPFALHGVYAICPGAADVDEPVEMQVRLLLAPSVPNPTRLSSQITYVIPGEMGERWVHLQVLDAAGRRVASLVDRSQLPGIYDLTWDGRDRSGAAVAAGVYFYRLDVGGRIETQSLVVIR